MSSVLKSKNSEVESYKFGQFDPNEIDDTSVQNFVFEALDKEKDFSEQVVQNRIRQERKLEAGSGFAISPTVKKHRGMVEQAESDYEKSVATEVAKRLEEIKAQAYQEGFDKGLIDGNEKALAEANVQIEEQVNELSGMIEVLNDTTAQIFEQSKNDAYVMIKNLTKWVVLKEIDEQAYLGRLLEKLIYEINSKSNLVLRVNESSFGYMPGVIKVIERKLGRLTNVRVEIDPDQTDPGIVLESENTIVNGSLDVQFQAIDKLFANSGVVSES